LAFESQQQLRVIASWSDGVVRDVTELARFHSNDEALATVDEDGLIHVGHVPGPRGDHGQFSKSNGRNQYIDTESHRHRR